MPVTVRFCFAQIQVNIEIRSMGAGFIARIQVIYRNLVKGSLLHCPNSYDLLEFGQSKRVALPKNR
ncbi:hypothetical protein CHR53_04735 [Neobacillus mesonae]|uniref:Uncharacterized protein n=1 Tax=Neobacillus mesonae TaxID=1193713 RepID=A0A3Q9QWU2_9BACI|nr:hypothetical protein CHR53_04735 [Neobacillus mesonae]